MSKKSAKPSKHGKAPQRSATPSPVREEEVEFPSSPFSFPEAQFSSEEDAGEAGPSQTTVVSGQRDRAPDACLDRPKKVAAQETAPKSPPAARQTMSELEEELGSSGSEYVPLLAHEVSSSDSEEESRKRASGKGGKRKKSDSTQASSSKLPAKKRARPSIPRAVQFAGSDSLVVDTQVLIGLVQERECLWQPQSRDWCNLTLKNQAWAKVAKKVAPDFWRKVDERDRPLLTEEIKRKWHSLRDRFAKDLNMEQEASRSGAGAQKTHLHHHFNDLQFLKASQAQRKTVSSVPCAVEPVLEREPAQESASRDPGDREQSGPLREGPVAAGRSVESAGLLSGLPLRALGSRRTNVMELVNHIKANTQALERLDQEMGSIRDNVHSDMLRLEGVVSRVFPSRTENLRCLLALLPYMDRIRPDLQDQCRIKLFTDVCECLNQSPPLPIQPQAPAPSRPRTPPQPTLSTPISHTARRTRQQTSSQSLTIPTQVQSLTPPAGQDPSLLHTPNPLPPSGTVTQQLAFDVLDLSVGGLLGTTGEASDQVHFSTCNSAKK